ncbi:MAG: AMP-binding protein, partial [Hyphomicrobiaceae bacterium]
MSDTHLIEVLDRRLAAAAARHGDRTFLECAGETRSFSEADRSASRGANGFIALGADRASKVAIMAVNSLAFVEAWLGAA